MFNTRLKKIIILFVILQFTISALCSTETFSQFKNRHRRTWGTSSFFSIRRYDVPDDSGEDGSDIFDDPISSDEDRLHSWGHSGSGSGYVYGLLGTAIALIATAPFTTPAAIAITSAYNRLYLQEYYDAMIGLWAAAGSGLGLSVLFFTIINLVFYNEIPVLPALTMAYYFGTALASAITSTASLIIQQSFGVNYTNFEIGATALSWTLTGLMSAIGTIVFVFWGLDYAPVAAKNGVTIRPEALGLSIRF